jgi:hypothetical protein
MRLVGKCGAPRLSHAVHAQIIAILHTWRITTIWVECRPPAIALRMIFIAERQNIAASIYKIARWCFENLCENLFVKE